MTLTRPRSDLLFGAGVVFVSLLAGRYASSPAFARDLFAIAFIGLVVAFGLRAPRALLLGLPVWVVALGLIRRLLSGISSAGPFDPLLLVAPLALIVLVFAAADRGAFRNLTTLSKLVLAFSGLVVLGAFNPTQPIAAGVTALIFFVPMLAFWIGRGLVDAALFRRVLLVVGIAAIPAALYGLFQTFVSFPSWDTRWIAAQGYAALDVNGATRPFSTFSSSAEYATFMAVGMLVWLRLGPRRMLRPIGLSVAGLVAVAAFYQSSRGTIVALIAAVAVMLAARRRLPLGFAIAGAAACLLVIPAVVSHFAPHAYSASGSSALVQHQLQGLSNPFDPNASTAGAHLHLISVGVQSAFRSPAGQGISTVTIAGQKFGAATNGTEVDLSNAAFALGLPGLLLFIALFVSGYGRAYRLARRGGALELLALGVLTVTAFEWLNGGQYAVAFLPWLALGWIDAEGTRPAEVVAEPVPTPVLRVAPPPRPRPRSRPLPPPPAESTPATPAVDADLNLFAIEKLPGLTEEQRFVLFYLRPYASSSGAVPPEFADLLRQIRDDAHS